MTASKNNIIYINKYLEEKDTIWVDLNYPIADIFRREITFNEIFGNKIKFISKKKTLD